MCARLVGGEGAQTDAREMYSRIKGFEDCDSESRISVKGEAVSRRLRRREMRSRLWVRR